MSSTMAAIDTSGFTAYFHINDDGKHTQSCIDNLSCIRYKMAPLVPLVWISDRLNVDNTLSAQPIASPDNCAQLHRELDCLNIGDLNIDDILAQPIDSLDDAQLHQELYHHPWASWGPWAKQVIPRREPVPAPKIPPPSSEWQARTRADPRVLAPGFSIPGRQPGREKPASPVPESPRPSSYWATSRQDPQTSQWQIRTLADPRFLAPGFTLPVREKPASPAPTTRAPPGLNVVFNTAELVQPKPVHPCGNSQAKSKMADFLARYSPNERDPSWAAVRARVLHPESDYDPWT
ncbi:hypothetical protein V8F33_002201 [Rhypophila sp. PSN 637]